MKVEVWCEESGTVRDAFVARGHDAYSVDILPRNHPRHITGDCLERSVKGLDMLICFPPCTYLCRAGQRWLKGNPRRWKQMEQGAAFFNALLERVAEVGAGALENPRMHNHARALVRPSDQRIQPWQFGHGETKETHLWIVGLPPLRPTIVVDGREGRVHMEPPGPLRQQRRSKTFQGIAEAMADQWGGIEQRRLR